MKNILLALELNSEDQVLLDQAGELAQKFNSKIWIVHITAPEPEFMGYDYGLQYIRDVRATELRVEHKKVQTYAEAYHKKGIHAESILLQGMLIDQILEEAEKLKIDLIMLGSHEHGFLYNALIGSTSGQILRKSRIPMYVIPIN